MNGVRRMDVARAVARLRDLREGPRALPDVILLGAAAIPELERALLARSSSIAQPRVLAAQGLRAIGGRSSRGALQRSLADSISRQLDPVERQAEAVVIAEMASALGAIGAHESADLLLRALALRPNPGCAEALGVLGDRRAIPLLVGALADAGARAPARAALLRFGDYAVPALAAAVRSGVPAGLSEGANSVRARTVVAGLLGELPGFASTAALRRAITDREVSVRNAAALALARRGDLSDGLVPILAEALAEDGWQVADDAAEALVRMATADALGAVYAVARRGRTFAGRLRAVRTLSRWPTPGGAAALATLRHDPEPLLRDALIEPLQRRPERVARRALDVLTRDPDRQIRRRAAEALGRSPRVALLRSVTEWVARARGGERARPPLNAGGRP